ncbi:MAG: thioredoxin domain-containing protein [Dehalococcoidia bacterium]|nr:thioredoxin domain-containing protein [Dehalococcoidia bacterium]MCB9486418.1 thioredoxin domain-containing protein [Thermoflexaceae bacterium]
MTRVPRPLLVAFAAITATGFAACGGDDDTGAPAGGTNSTSATTSATSPAATPDPFRDYAALSYPVDLVDGDSIGKADAPVTLTLYEDFQCPFCLQLTLAYEGMLIQDYVKTGKVLLQFRHYAILGPESQAAATAAICVANQDKFWPFHHRLFLLQAREGQLKDEVLNKGRFSDVALREIAAQVGADPAAYDACIADPATLQRLQADARDARWLGLRGTPGVVIDGHALGGAPADEASFRRVLDAAIANK